MKSKMNVLIACEESQVVCKAFREHGQNAFSCDLLPASGEYPEWHYQADCTEVMKIGIWDLIIFHPPCTCMAVSGNRWYGRGTAGYSKRLEAINWTLEVWNIICKHSKASVLENPVSVIFSATHLLHPQYIQPWMFGHGETKKPGLFLRNVPPLKPTNIVSGREQKVWKMPPSKDRSRLRSKTYTGIADAMASQWSIL